MPLAQLADPWQKMAVESPSDSAEVSAAGRRARRAPSPRPRRLALFPGAALRPSSPAHILSRVRDSALGRWGLPICLFLPPSPLLSIFFLGGGCRCGGAWGLEWALSLCKEPVLINFAWGKQEAEREPAGSWEVWPCGLRGLLRILSDFGVMGLVHPGSKS